MIRVRCDKCEKLLEAPDDLAGQKIECPSCGDVRMLPGTSPPTETAVAARSAAPRTPTDRAAAAGLPPDSGPEQRVLVVHPVMFRSSPLWGAILILGGVAAIVGLIYFGAYAPKALGTTGARVGAWASAAGLGLSLAGLAGWWVAHLGTRLEVTSKRTVARRGLISRATTEVLHDDIKNVQVSQTMGQRLMGIGRLSLSSSADDEAEIVMDDLPHPERIRRTIDLYRPL